MGQTPLSYCSTNLARRHQPTFNARVKFSKFLNRYYNACKAVFVVWQANYLYHSEDKKSMGIRILLKENKLIREEEALGMPEDPNATVAAQGKETSTETPGTAQYLIGKLFINLSNNIFNKTGVRVLDPSANKSPPKWAREYPALWSTFQVVADLAASDPFTAASFFIPVGSIGAKGIAVLEKLGLKNVSSYASKSLYQLIMEQAPNRVGEILNALKNTEVSAVAKDFLANMSKQNANYQERMLVTQLSGVDNNMIQNYAKAARETIKRAASGELSKYAQVVADSIVNNQFYVVFSEDAVRPVVVIDTQYGKIPFYRSSGQSTPGIKLEGEWHMFGGMKPHSRGGIIYSKNSKSVALTNGGNQYLTKISLALEEAWNAGLISQKAQRINLKSVVSEYLPKINSRIERMNQQAGKEAYALYTVSDLQDAYLNHYLKDSGALGEGTIANIIDTSQQFIGLTDSYVFGKLLPAIFK